MTFSRRTNLAMTLLGLIGFVMAIQTSSAQSNDQLASLTTAPERTNFDQTTSYEEVLAFLNTAVSNSTKLHQTTFGYSFEGRPLPLVVFGDVESASPEDVLASGKLRVFIQANIHAGEVCGKEALLMMIRSMAEGEYSELLSNMVVIMAPIYNADGNEKVNLFNRPRQNGPHGGMGQRPNAQGLDLNRDHMKVKSPEARSLIGVFNAYDPHVVMDLHTTNGTRHGYHITYSTPLSPNTDQTIDTFLRDKWMKDVTIGFHERSGWDAYFYGNLPFRQGESGWYTFDNRPRFNNNYVGLRNRMAILSEGYAYATFEERILATRYFVEEVLTFASKNRRQIEKIITDSDSKDLKGELLGVRFEPFQSKPAAEILMGDVYSKTNKYSGATYFDRMDTVYTQVMPEYGAFIATEKSRVPDSYYVGKVAAPVVKAYLDTHGIRYSEIVTDQTAEVEGFVVATSEAASSEFQSIFERTITGTYTATSVNLEAGSLVIDTNQPLARLAFYLLEPRSDDGLVNWAQMDRWVESGMTYPVYRSVN
ncbi:MAG: M14 family metallopeptidase [Bacteroidetes bacterium]|nr:M14 family metallopeptidase [Bacteroidota bacterium]